MGLSSAPAKTPRKRKSRFRNCCKAAAHRLACSNIKRLGKFVCHQKFSLAKPSYLAIMGGQLGKGSAASF
jgi:hypothetical protein